MGDRRGEATTLKNIGLVYSDLGEKQKALEYLNQALPLNRAVGNRGGEANTLFNLASLERNRGNLEQSLKQISSAIEIIEDLRTKVVNQDLRTSYFASVQYYYKFYIDLLMQLHKKNPSKGYDALALHISERSRARGLIELLNSAGAEIRKGVDPKLLAEESRLRLLLDAREKQLSGLLNQKSPPAQLIATTEKEIKNFLNQQKEIEEKIRAINPERAELTNPKNLLKLPGIQQQLDKDTLLLQYSLGKEHSYLWAVTPDSFQSYELPKQEEIKKAADTLYTLLHGWSIDGASAQDKAKALAQTAKAANELSQLILAPVANKLGQKRLVVVTDGILYKIPFAVLADLTPQPSSVKGNGKQETLPSPSSRAEVNYQPLIVNHEIINLPSVSSLATHRQKLKGRKIAPKTLAILADPIFSADDTTNKPQDSSSSMELNLERSALRRACSGKFSKLQHSKEEAENIMALVSSPERLWAFGFDANYKFATSPQLSQYRLLHFSTHGCFDEQNPELSGIVLSTVDKQGKSQRSFLRLNDIFNLDYPAELIVLSACETGLGQQVEGEGLMGLTRGLMYAGGARVAVSLWSVNDKSTSLLMQEFYKQMLQQRKSPTAALRATQIHMWKQKDLQNPYYWAAFTLQGEWH